MAGFVGALGGASARGGRRPAADPARLYPRHQLFVDLRSASLDARLALDGESTPTGGTAWGGEGAAEPAVSRWAGRGEEGGAQRRARRPAAAPAPHGVHPSPHAAHPIPALPALCRPHSWTKSLRTLVQVAASERGLATAVFADPHDETAFVSIVGGAVTRLISAGRAIVATQQDADKVGAAFGLGGRLTCSARRLAPRFLPHRRHTNSASSSCADDGPHRHV